MDLKDFLWPDWRRVLLFVLLAVVGVFVSLPLSVLEHRSAACSPGLYEKDIMADCMEVVVVHPNVLLNFLVYYLLSCLLVYLWDRLRKK